MLTTLRQPHISAGHLCFQALSAKVFCILGHLGRDHLYYHKLLLLGPCAKALHMMANAGTPQSSYG
jgi:hypothetical protein